jgi:hypothetical protein
MGESEEDPWDGIAFSNSSSYLLARHLCRKGLVALEERSR